MRYMNNKIKNQYSKKLEKEEIKKFWDSQKKNSLCPKLIKSFKETSFSHLAESTNSGEVFEFEPSDNGESARQLYSQMDFEILTTGLSETEKEAVGLREENNTREEIAKDMGKEPNAVKQLLYRADCKMKKKIIKAHKNQWKKISNH